MTPALLDLDTRTLHLLTRSEIQRTYTPACRTRVVRYDTGDAAALWDRAARLCPGCYPRLVGEQVRGEH